MAGGANQKKFMDNSRPQRVGSAAAGGVVDSNPQVASDGGGGVGQSVPSQAVPSDTSRVDMTSTKQPDKGPGVNFEEANGPLADVSPTSSINQADLGPGFAYIDGEIGGTGYNDTKVDVITVACPGADPVQTWTLDPLPQDVFGPGPSTELRRMPTTRRPLSDIPALPALDHPLPKAGQVWVRQGIRRSANTARVMLYRHRPLSEGINLESLARDLLDQVQQQRQGTRPSRPVFFIAHSIGGLVVKLALLLASKLPQYREIKYNCHGVVFFATPHRGSSYLSMRGLKTDIQKLLRLQRPLPRSLSDEVHVGHPSLLKMQEEFADISSELRLWSFYETMDSQLSDSRTMGEVQFGAPLVSIKSAFMDFRHEDLWAVENDHARMASFGLNNINTMMTFLVDFGAAIQKARKLSAYIHAPLRLKEHVKVEIIGFYEDPDTEIESTIRLYSTRYHLGEFLEKGPEKCLEERLNRVSRRQGSPNRATLDPRTEQAGLGLWNNVQRMWEASPESTLGTLPDMTGTGPGSPDIIITTPSARPSISHQGQVHGGSAPALSTTNSRRSSSSTEHSIASTVSEPAMQLSNIDVAGMARPDLRRSGFVIRDPAAGFSRPDPNLRKFMWIHTPFTNPVWVRNIFDKLSDTQNYNFSRLFDYDNWESKHVHSSHSQAQPSFLKPACSYLTADSPSSPWVPSPQGGRATPGITPNCLYMYLPYLHFDTYQSIVRRRNLLKRRLAHGRATPVPQDIADLESLELRVMWEYIGFDPPLNCRRTLDQYGYPSLQDTNARDDDQMLYKLTKQDPQPSWSRMRATGVPAPAPGAAEKSGSDGDESSGGEDGDSSEDETTYEEESDLRDGNLLMVDQLWLWAIDTTTLTTFFPKRESDPREGTLFQQGDLRNSVYNELNGDLTGRTENALDLAAFIVFHAVTVFLDRASHPDLEIFRIFEEAIGMLAERMTQNMKHFRLQTFKAAMHADEESESEDESEENSPAAIKRRHKRELERAERENRENTSALLELRDMEDELTTLLKLFETQESSIKTLKTTFLSRDLRDITTNGQFYLDEALEYLDEYKQNAREMLKRVDTVRKDYEKMLEMAQRQAQVDEVRWSRVQTELASSQNLSVMIFTTFTVIFLPLSFFTGLFGVNVTDWQDETMPSLKEVGLISLPVSAFLVILSLVAAYNWRAQVAVRSAFRAVKRTLVGTGTVLKRLEPRRTRAKKQRRKDEERRRRRVEQEKREKEKSYDFWAAVKKGRATTYQIPHLNRHIED